MHAPVASWNSICAPLFLSAANKWHAKQLDFALAFTKVPVEHEIFMKISKGFEIEDGNNNNHILQLHKKSIGRSGPDMFRTNN